MPRRRDILRVRRFMDELAFQTPEQPQLLEPAPLTDTSPAPSVALEGQELVPVQPDEFATQQELPFR